MEGAISAIREEKLGGKHIVVVNELTPISRAALADEIVTMAIATPLANLCRELVQLMVEAVDSGPATHQGKRSCLWSFTCPRISRKDGFPSCHFANSIRNERYHLHFCFDERHET